MKRAFSASALPILSVMLMAIAVCVASSPASAYALSFDPIDTGYFTYEYYWTQNELHGDLHTGTVASGATVTWDSLLDLLPGKLDVHVTYHPPEYPVKPYSFFDLMNFQGTPGLWEGELLDNQVGTVTIPGLNNGSSRLYVATNLKLYSENNPNPGFTPGQSLQITNGNMAGVQGLKVSTTPVTVNLNSPTGFSGSWYTGNVQVDALFTGTPIPEPSSMLALASGLLGLASVIRRRKK
jgi:hypothetical protein